MTTKYQVIYWRDIPAQIKVRSDDKRAGHPLSKRFQVAIDNAAMRAGKTGSEAYMAEWRMSAWQEREGDPESLAEALAMEFENEYPAARLQELVRKGGLADGESLEVAK